MNINQDTRYYVLYSQLQNRIRYGEIFMTYGKTQDELQHFADHLFDSGIFQTHFLVEHDLDRIETMLRPLLFGAGPYACLTSGLGMTLEEELMLLQRTLVDTTKKIERLVKYSARVSRGGRA